MTEYTRSMFSTENQYNKACAELWEQRFKWLIDQYWVEAEAGFRLGLSVDTDNDKYMREFIEAVDKGLGR